MDFPPSLVLPDIFLFWVVCARFGLGLGIGMNWDELNLEIAKLRGEGHRGEDRGSS